MIHLSLCLTTQIWAMVSCRCGCGWCCNSLFAHIQCHGVLHEAHKLQTNLQLCRSPGQILIAVWALLRYETPWECPCSSLLWQQAQMCASRSATPMHPGGGSQTLTPSMCLSVNKISGGSRLWSNFLAGGFCSTGVVLVWFWMHSAGNLILVLGGGTRMLTPFVLHSGMGCSLPRRHHQKQVRARPSNL